MPLQDRIIPAAIIGTPGQKADNEPSVYAGNCLAGAGVTVGRFVWIGADNVASPTGAGVPSGLVERNITFPIYDLKAEASMSVPQGWEITVAIRGRYYIVSTTVAVPGNKVIVKTADATISTGDAGGTGLVLTSWTVKVGGAAGEPIIVEYF